MDITFVSLMVAIGSGLILLATLCYFLYQKRKQLQHYEQHAPQNYEPSFGNLSSQTQHKTESINFDSFSEKQQPSLSKNPYQTSGSFAREPYTNNNPFTAIPQYANAATNVTTTTASSPTLPHTHASMSAATPLVVHPLSEECVTTAPETSLDAALPPTYEDMPNEFQEDVVASDYEEMDEPLMVLYVVAEADKPYVGYELLQALLSAGLRYGEMNIFHRYERVYGRGSPLFSLASVTEPGTFDLNRMGEVCCNGLCLFIKLDENKEPILAFEKMLDTAHQLIDDLGGEIFDEQRRPLDHAIITEYRARVRDYALHAQQHVSNLN